LTSTIGPLTRVSNMVSAPFGRDIPLCTSEGVSLGLFPWSDFLAEETYPCMVREETRGTTVDRWDTDGRGVRPRSVVRVARVSMPGVWVTSNKGESETDRSTACRDGLVGFTRTGRPSPIASISTLAHASYSHRSTLYTMQAFRGLRKRSTRPAHVREISRVTCPFVLIGVEREFVGDKSRLTSFHPTISLVPRSDRRCRYVGGAARGWRDPQGQLR
jgi:hypothetical protein